MTDYADLEKRLLERADVWEKIGQRHAAYNDSRMISDMREAAEALGYLRQAVIAFCAPHAVRYANDFGLAPRELHSAHYDILAACGARMDDFFRAEESSGTRMTEKTNDD